MKYYDIVLTEQFDASLRETVDWIRADAPLVAETFQEGVFDALETMRAFPFKSVEISPNIYRKIIKGYWLPYTVKNDVIYVLDLIHPRQDTKARRYRAD